MPSRRAVLRRLSGGLALGTLATTAGCSATVPALSRSGASFGGHASHDDALSEAQFVDYTARMRDRYGDAGVWGLDGAPETPTFLGAWTSATVSPTDDDHSLVDSADFAVACYRVDTGSEENEQHYRYWLWALLACPRRRPTTPASAGGR